MSDEWKEVVKNLVYALSTHPCGKILQEKLNAAIEQDKIDQ